MGIKLMIPWRETFIISFGPGSAALYTLKAPTLFDDAIKSPEILSAHYTLEIPAFYCSNSIRIYGSSYPNK